MCVKEFLGFTCGHCSVPYLRQCPLTASQPIFPPCKFPAERPMFANEYCPPCSRVVWNINVLQREEIHRGMHQRGECECEVIFSEEERQRRDTRRHNRSRPAKGKGTETGDSISIASNTGRDEQSTGTEGPQVLIHIASSGNNSANPNCPKYDQRPEVIYGYGNYAFAQPVYTPPQHASTSSQYVRPAAPSDYNNQQFVGYPTADYEQSSDMLQIAEGNGFPVNGCAPHEIVWPGQTQIGQAGAGMMWYPGETLPPLPEMPALALNNAAYRDVCHAQVRNQPACQRAISEPTESTQYPMSPASTVVDAAQGCRNGNYARSESEVQTETEEPEEHAQPMVVSSNMAAPKSG